MVTLKGEVRFGDKNLSGSVCDGFRREKLKSIIKRVSTMLYPCSECYMCFLIKAYKELAKNNPRC